MTTTVNVSAPSAVPPYPTFTLVHGCFAYLERLKQSLQSPHVILVLSLTHCPAVKPELPYVMLTKLVIASSPRKMLTLNQVRYPKA